MEKIFSKPALIAGAVAVITVFFALQLPKVELDNNNIRFLPEKNQAKIISNYIDDAFGGQVIILVGLERPYKSIFDREFLQRIKEFSLAVEKVAFVKSINSIMSTQYITGDAESIIVSDLVPDDFSGTQDEIAELKRRIGSWDLFRGSIVSDDLAATQVLITFDVFTEDFSRPEVVQSLNKIKRLAGEIFTKEEIVYFAGQPILNATINESIIMDNLVLIPLVILVVLFVLYFSFRRFIFIILPLLTVAIAVIWTIGLTTMFGVKLSVITTILPVILVAVGHAYGVHIITHYVRDIRKDIQNVDEHKIIVFELMKKMIKPVSLAAITTITGFLSFCFTPIVPMQEFGMCASLGVLTVYIVVMFFIPAMLLLRGPRILKLQQAGDNYNHVVNKSDNFSNLIANIFLGIAEKKKLVLFIAAVLVIISIIGLLNVVVDNSVVDFFRKETEISRSDSFIRKHFGGSRDINIAFRAGTTEEILHPVVLSAVDNLSQYLTKNVPNVGKVTGFTDIIKRINQVFNIDQNPEGLQPVVSYNDPSGAFGFSSDGFGFQDSNSDSFGFGSFGFNNDSAAQNNFYDAPAQSYDLSMYSASDIIGLLEKAAGINPVMSGSELVRELKRLTNFDGMSYYEIPSDPARYGKETDEELQRLIANYLVLLAGDEDSGFSDDPLEPTAVRILVQIRTTGTADTKEIIKIIENFIEANFPKNITVLIGGSSLQEMAITDLIFNSQIISIFISVMMVLLIVGFFHKSLIAGIVGAVPLVLAVMCNFAIMGLLGVKLNLGTALIASLTVSIGIDDAIHFLEFFKKEFKLGEEGALRRTFLACGRAICVTAISVGAGFAVLAFSQFKIIMELGLLIGFSMVSTTLVTLTIMPALLMVIRPKFIYGEKKK